MCQQRPTLPDRRCSLARYIDDETNEMKNLLILLFPFSNKFLQVKPRILWVCDHCDANLVRNAERRGRGFLRNVTTPTDEGRTHHRRPLRSLSLDAMHPWLVQSAVRGGGSRGALSLGHELFAVNGDGRCRRRCPTPKLYNEQPKTSVKILTRTRTGSHTFKVDDMTSSEGLV